MLKHLYLYLFDFNVALIVVYVWCYWYFMLFVAFFALLCSIIVNLAVFSCQFTPIVIKQRNNFVKGRFSGLTIL